MKESVKNLAIDWMYFKGIRDGDITTLFFNTEVLFDLQKGDIFTVTSGTESFKLYFEKSGLTSFRNVTDKMAKEAGFKSKELLAYHLISKNDIALNPFTPERSLNKELFFYVTFKDDPSKIFVDDGESLYRMNSLARGGFYQYNPDYSNKIWEDERK